jgi:hypothetical protein
MAWTILRGAGLLEIVCAIPPTTSFFMLSSALKSQPVG